MYTRRPSMPSLIGSSTSSVTPPRASTASSKPPKSTMACRSIETPLKPSMPALPRPAPRGVDRLREAPEVRGGVSVYGDTGQVLHHRHRPLRAAVEVGGVDAILHPRLHFHQEIPRHRECLDLPGPRAYPNQHHRVRVGRRTLAGARSPVHPEDQHDERLFGDLGWILGWRVVRRVV